MGNIETYYQACRDRFASQETDRREFSVKTLGILTFGATVFGVATSLVEPGQELDVPAWTLILFMGFLFVLMVIFALLVLMPKSWENPFSASKLQEEFNKHKGGDFVEGVADSYVGPIGRNRYRLNKEADYLRCLIVLGVTEVAIFIAFRLYLMIPPLCSCSC